MSKKKLIYPLIIPSILILLSGLLVLRWPYLLQRAKDVNEVRAFLVLLPLLPYVFFSIAVIIGWNLNSIGAVLASSVLTILYFEIGKTGTVNLQSRDPVSAVSAALAFLLPLNFIFFAVLRRQKLFNRNAAYPVISIVLQIAYITLLSHITNNPHSRLMFYLNNMFPELTKFTFNILNQLISFTYNTSLFGFKNISSPAIAVFLFAACFILWSFIISTDILLVGFLGALIASFIGISAGSPVPSMIIFFSTAGLILTITAIHASFLMAYVDEVTGLPGRRKLNDVLETFRKKYTIAMIDIDYFKKVNDTYGHEVGDQVLKMVAGKLGKMPGNPQTFRYGGEEFTAIFPGTSIEEVLPLLEVFKRDLSATSFIIRSRERIKRNEVDRGKVEIIEENRLKLTVSIGVASDYEDSRDPKKILTDADKMLLKAKASGRNKVTALVKGAVL